MHLAQHDDITSLLRKMFAAAIASAQPALRIPAVLADCLPVLPNGRLIVIGAGKASAAMAQAVEASWTGTLQGVVVTRYGYGAACQHIQILEAAHPVPDAASISAAHAIWQAVSGLTAHDVVLCLISGGGSSLLCLPGLGLSLDDKQRINRQLLKSGASIHEMNCVRRHLSAIKGGRLAAACYPARVINLLISDVPGDDPIQIASGPTVADPTTCADALQILQRYQIDVPEAVMVQLRQGAVESIKPGDSRMKNVTTHMIATPQMALEAAASVAREQGIAVHILGDAIEGEARDVGKVMAGIALQVKQYAQPFRCPCILLSGGETTVTVKGNGRGGRNVEWLLSLTLALQGRTDIYALAGDTDGVDGQEEIAGAMMTPTTLQRALQKKMQARHYLDNNDAHSFFEALGDQIVTGPTQTNVNDFRAIYIG